MCLTMHGVKCHSQEFTGYRFIRGMSGVLSRISFLRSKGAEEDDKGLKEDIRRDLGFLLSHCFPLGK